MTSKATAAAMVAVAAVVAVAVMATTMTTMTTMTTTTMAVAAAAEMTTAVATQQRWRAHTTINYKWSGRNGGVNGNDNNNDDNDDDGNGNGNSDSCDDDNDDSGGGPLCCSRLVVVLLSAARYCCCSSHAVMRSLTLSLPAAFTAFAAPVVCWHLHCHPLPDLVIAHQCVIFNSLIAALPPDALVAIAAHLCHSR